MSVIDRTVTRDDDGARFTVTAWDEAAGRFTLAPVDFGQSIAVSYVDLFARFDVKPDEVTLPATEREVIKAQDDAVNADINAVYSRAHPDGQQPRKRGPFVPSPDSPEGIFSQMSRTECDS